MLGADGATTTHNTKSNLLLTDLPTELIQAIAENLSNRDMGNLRAVNAELSHIVSIPEIRAESLTGAVAALQTVRNVRAIRMARLAASAADVDALVSAARGSQAFQNGHLKELHIELTQGSR